MINDAKLTELAIRVMNDFCPLRYEEIDAAYLVAQTHDNENSVLNKYTGHACTDYESYAYCGPKIILISNNVDATEAISGYPGALAWMDKLDDKGFRGMEDPQVLSFDVHGPANTLTELTAMVGYAKENGWQSMGLVAAPFHQLRMFMTVVSVLLKEYPHLRVYNEVGCELDWNAPVKHSQNEKSSRRADVIAKEIERIHKYHEEGDLVDVETVLEYLDRRDRA